MARKASDTDPIARAKAAASSLPSWSPAYPDEEPPWAEERRAIRAAISAYSALSPLERYLRFVARLLRKPYEPRIFYVMYLLLRSRFPGQIDLASAPKIELWEMAHVEMEDEKRRLAKVKAGRKGAVKNVGNRNRAQSNRAKVERAALDDERPSQREAAKRLGLSRETVRKYWPRRP